MTPSIGLTLHCLAGAQPFSCKPVKIYTALFCLHHQSVLLCKTLCKSVSRALEQNPSRFRNHASVPKNAINENLSFHALLFHRLCTQFKIVLPPPSVSHVGHYKLAFSSLLPLITLLTFHKHFFSPDTWSYLRQQSPCLQYATVFNFLVHFFLFFLPRQPV